MEKLAQSMTSLDESSYLAQVRRLRRMADQVVTQFPLKNYELSFIHHGENATFKITTPQKNYLLRLHRNGYHTQPAILEELKWLAKLSEESDIPVQRPLLSRSGHFVERQAGHGTPARFCSVLEWQSGRIRFKKIGPKGFYAIGELTARLHLSAAKLKTRHRNYWSADGLLGREAKLGSLFDLKGVLSSGDYSELEKCRRMVHAHIAKYQKRNPHKMSLIHADLHFGNILWECGTVKPIDFDDCGLGFQPMDLAVTLISSSNLFKDKGIKQSRLATEALFEGYSRHLNLSNEDLATIPYFVLTRKLAMVGWLYQRRDNPRLLSHFNKTIKGNIQVFRKALVHGPHPIF
jgi:Ser/Thr protein kinase RdoA (MazF antagonist)